MVWISFVLVILYFYNPILGVWRRLVGTSLNIAMPPFLAPEPPGLGGPGMGVKIPFGASYNLFIQGFIAWVILVLLFWALENYVGINILEWKIFRKLDFSNGLLYGQNQKFNLWMRRISKWVVYFVLGKTILTGVVKLIVISGLPKIIDGWLLAQGILNLNIGKFFKDTLGGFLANHEGMALDFFLGYFCLMLLIVSYAFEIEKNIRSKNKIKSNQIARRN